jgi:hypothetical protein
MATNANALNVVGLDFSEAKASLKAFLESQDTLKDYNFNGSVLSTILDVMAYNTHYQGFYANMVANEMFLDSAVLRPSIASHAKQLGYTPQSARAAKATLTVPISSGSSTTDTYLARGTEFTGTDPEGSQYKFILLENAYADTTTNSFEEVDVYEGSLRRVSYVYDRNRKDLSVLLIPNDKVDTTTIRVRVQASVTDSTGSSSVWSEAASYVNLTPTSKVFFLQEKEKGLYELYFGDGFLGQEPETGNLISIEYLETNGAAANGISDFTSAVSGLGTVETVSESAGGGDAETSVRIKFMAPKYYKSQSRAVTENDYITAVNRYYPDAASVYVYGGETVTPPQYGKVFIAIRPTSGQALSTSEKESLVRNLRNNASVVSIIPEIVDTDYLDLVVDSKITYNPSALNISAGTLKALAVAYAFSYSNIQLNSFGSNFYYSAFIKGISDLHPSILSNQTTVKLRKTVEVGRIVSSKGLVIDFGNSLYHPHDGHISILSSNMFPHKNYDGTTVYNCTLEDDGYGVLNVVKYETSGAKTVVLKGVGTIEYSTGIIRLNSKFVPQIAEGIVYGITVTVQPQNQDLYVKENRIIRINRGYSDSVSVSLSSETVSRAAAIS